MTAFAGWENFYVIVGSSAGALIGLQFVVITLIADRPLVANQSQAGGAFATPTVVHFGAALLLSAIVTAPWREPSTVAAVLGFMGVAGVVYEIIVLRRMRRQTIYKPVLEDWLFHVVFPIAAYATLAGSAYAVRTGAPAAMFAVGAAALVLLFTGIHNAWDTATYHIFTKKSDRK
jgi:hypothetical protein